jgi:hypothetical protein
MDMKLFLQIMANASGLKREMGESKNAVTRFTQGAKRELDSLKGAAGSLQGKLAGIGISIGAIQQLSQSARLDKGLVQVRQTAGEGQEMVKGLRREFFLMAKDSGQQVEGLKDGFDGLIASGQSWKAALESTKGINIAQAVTGAQGSVLAGGLTVGATAFNIDLEQPGKALELLDKMTVAGRQGNAELQNLADIFGRVGVNAASAGLGFDSTLGFIEALSLVERSPERLATLADSTLRLFTNLNYMKATQKGTGVKFFDAAGARRDAVDVLQDIKGQWDKLGTDKDRALFIQKAFGKADLDTIKGMKTLLSGESLNKVRNFTKEIGSASGTLKRDMPDAIANAVDQTGRLKANLREAADGFAQPINKALADFIQFSMAGKKDGGLDLSGKEMIFGGGALALGTLLTARYGGKAIGSVASRLLAKGGSTAIGVAEGKALEAAAGITPVFITNWPVGGMPGMVPGIVPAGGKVFGLAGLGLPAAVVAAPLIAKVISDSQRRNGWGSQTIGRDSREYEVMGISGRRGSASQQNQIQVDVHFDELGRAYTRTNSMATTVKAGGNRGNFFDAMTSTKGM